MLKVCSGLCYWFILDQQIWSHLMRYEVLIHLEIIMNFFQMYKLLAQLVNTTSEAKCGGPHPHQGIWARMILCSKPSWTILELLRLWWKTVTKSNFGRKGAYLTFTSISQFFIEGSQGKNSNRTGCWRQELMQKSGRNTAFCLALLAFSVCFLRAPRTTSPGVVPPTLDWALAHQTRKIKMCYRFAYSQILWRYFLSWGPLLSYDSS